MKLNLYICFSWIFLFLSQTALSESNFPEIPSKNKPLSISLHANFYRSAANYKELGAYKNLPNKNYFQYFGFYPTIRYSPVSHYISFQIFSRNFYAESKTNDLKRKVFRTSEVGGGFSIYYKFKNLYSGFEFRGGVPIYRPELTNSNEMIVGDGAYFAEPGLWFLFRPFRIRSKESLYLYYNTAFRYRTLGLSNNLSGLLLNRLGTFIKTMYIDGGAETSSFFSVLSDTYSLEPEKRWGPLKKVNGESYKFRSVNPSVLDFTFWMEFKFKPIFTKIYFNVDSFGKNYAKGLSFGFITTLKLYTKSSIIKKRRNRATESDFYEIESPRTRHSKKGNSYFEEEDDPYNKKIINKELKKELDSLRY